jgi:hypothetical protein
MELRFMRDTDKREVDFVVLQNHKPIFAVECKTGFKEISPNIKYFSQRTQIPVFYQVHLSTSDFENRDFRVRVLPFLKFVSEINCP